ncbi:unnamed protein product [Arctogadus glacialis]
MGLLNPGGAPLQPQSEYSLSPPPSNCSLGSGSVSTPSSQTYCPASYGAYSVDHVASYQYSQYGQAGSAHEALHIFPLLPDPYPPLSLFVCPARPLGSGDVRRRWGRSMA